MLVVVSTERARILIVVGAGLGISGALWLLRGALTGVPSFAGPRVGFASRLQDPGYPGTSETLLLRLSVCPCFVGQTPGNARAVPTVPIVREAKYGAVSILHAGPNR